MRRRGSFVRALDGRRVQRFQCTACGRSFSAQTFRADYRLRRPETLALVERAAREGLGLRATARVLGLGRDHVARRLRQLRALGRDPRQASAAGAAG